MKIINGLLFRELSGRTFRCSYLKVNKDVFEILNRYDLLDGLSYDDITSGHYMRIRDRNLLLALYENGIFYVWRSTPIERIIAKYREAVPTPRKGKIVRYVNDLPIHLSAGNSLIITLSLPFSVRPLERALKYKVSKLIPIHLGQAVSNMGEAYYFSAGWFDSPYQIQIEFIANSLNAKDKLAPTIKIIDAFIKAMRQPVTLERPAEKFEEQHNVDFNWNRIKLAIAYIIKGTRSLHIKCDRAIMDKVAARFSDIEPKVDKIRIYMLDITPEITVPEYHLRTGEKRVLLAIKKPIWPNEYSKFYIAFKSTPRDALKYGTNALHYLEHILCNIIKDCGEFVSYNASTHSDGFMDFYFISSKEKLHANLKAFFKGLHSMFDIKSYQKYKQLYRREQRRVTSETDHARLSYTSMFTENDEIYLGAFQAETVWHLLLYDCDLVRISNIVHADLKDAFESYAKEFDKLCGEFLKRWLDRFSLSKKPPEIPMIGIGVPTAFMQPPRLSKGKWIDAPLVFDENPIINAIVESTLPHYFRSSDYLSKRFLQALRAKPTTITLQLRSPPPPCDQFGYLDILTFSPNIAEDEFNEYIYGNSEKFLKKYRKEALAIIMKQYELLAKSAVEIL